MEYIENNAPEILNEPWRSYPYEFRVGWRMYLNKEIRKWANETIKDWKHIDGSFLFKTEEDAIAFKLMWM